MIIKDIRCCSPIYGGGPRYPTSHFFKFLQGVRMTQTHASTSQPCREKGRLSEGDPMGALDGGTLPSCGGSGRHRGPALPPGPSLPPEGGEVKLEGWLAYARTKDCGTEHLGDSRWEGEHSKWGVKATGLGVALELEQGAGIFCSLL